jgi:hypothetical protein
MDLTKYGFRIEARAPAGEVSKGSAEDLFNKLAARFNRILKIKIDELHEEHKWLKLFRGDHTLPDKEIDNGHLFFELEVVDFDEDEADKYDNNVHLSFSFGSIQVYDFIERGTLDKMYEESAQLIRRASIHVVKDRSNPYAAALAKF